jgi:choline-sulfatase
MRGQTLVPAMRGEPLPARDVFSETDYRAYTYKRSVVTPDGWKLIYTLETKSRELYDLNSDPGERKNRGADEPQRADELERRLFAHFKAIGHDLTAREWKVGLNPVYNSQAK